MDKTQELIDKYRIMVGNLVYDSEEQRVHEHVEMILEEMKKDKEKYEKNILDSK